MAAPKKETAAQQASLEAELERETAERIAMLNAQPEEEDDDEEEVPVKRPTRPGIGGLMLDIRDRYTVDKQFGIREVILIFAVAGMLYSGYNVMQHGAGIVSLGMIPIGIAFGLLAGGCWWLGRLMFYVLRPVRWPVVLFIEEGKYAYEIRVRHAQNIAPPGAHFNRGMRMMAFKWQPQPFDADGWKSQNPEYRGDKEAVKRAKQNHMAMIKRFSLLPDVDSNMRVWYGRYIKHTMKLRRTPLGSNWKWATHRYFYEYSPLRRQTVQSAAKAQARSTASKRKDADMNPERAGDAFLIIGRMLYDNPTTMTPQTFYSRLTNGVVERALTPRVSDARMKQLKQFSIGVLALLVGAIFFMFVLGSGQPAEPSKSDSSNNNTTTTQTSTATTEEVAERQQTLQATATAIAQEEAVEQGDANGSQ